MRYSLRSRKSQHAALATEMDARTQQSVSSYHTTYSYCLESINCFGDTVWARPSQGLRACTHRGGLALQRPGRRQEDGEQLVCATRLFSFSYKQRWCAARRLHCAQRMVICGVAHIW